MAAGARRIGAAARTDDGASGPHWPRRRDAARFLAGDRSPRVPPAV